MNNTSSLFSAIRITVPGVYLMFIIMISISGYLLLAHLIPRVEFYHLLTVFSILFAAYFLLLKTSDEYFNILIWSSLLFRACFFFSLPELSDDFYRFIWDGRLFAAGYNPFSQLPADFLQQAEVLPGIDGTLFQKLNSPQYYSVYPPFLQFIYGLAGWMVPDSINGNVQIIRAFIFLAETGSILLLGRLLYQFNIPRKNLLLYGLNPLVIVELSGNLHPEAFMIFFLLLSVYLVVKNHFVGSAVAFGLAICSKLIPLLLLPFLFKRLGTGRAFQYFGTVGIACLILFLPFISLQMPGHLFNSLNLYFQHFEFNASVYYLLREAGYWIYGYNIIGMAGIILGVFVTVLIICLSFIERIPVWRNFPTMAFLSLSIYLFLSTTIHPWYVTPLVAFSCFIRFRYAIFWSALVLLSYSAYQTVDYKEHLSLVSLEYALVFIIALIEWRRSKKTPLQMG